MLMLKLLKNGVLVVLDYFVGNKEVFPPFFSQMLLGPFAFEVFFKVMLPVLDKDQLPFHFIPFADHIEFWISSHCLYNYYI